MNQELVIKSSSIANSLAENAALEEIMGEETNHSLKDAWIKLGDQLEIDGISQENIASVATNLILTKKSEKINIPKTELRMSGYFYRIYQEKGWTNQLYARNTTVPLGEQENSSLNTNNQDIINIFYEIKDICNLAITKAKEIKPFEDIFGEKETREFYKQLQSMIKNCRYAFDGKTKVPSNTEQVLLECVAVCNGSITDGGIMYMKARTKLLEKQRDNLLTTKQLSRFQKGDKISRLYLLKPRSRDTAVFLDYIGVQCKCDSWRVRLKSDSPDVECYDCGKSFSVKTVSKCRYCQTPLYKEQLLHMVNNGGRCENCHTANIIPHELIEYAQS